MNKVIINENKVIELHISNEIVTYHSLEIAINHIIICNDISNSEKLKLIKQLTWESINKTWD